MSIRGVISGVAGSAAVAVVAILGLGTTHAAADPKQTPAQAQAEVARPWIARETSYSTAPVLRPARGPTVAQPVWLRRLLQRIDPAMEAAPMEAKRRRS